MSNQKLDAALRRRLQHENGIPVGFPSFDEVVERLSSGTLRIYNGIDATSPHLHIGHTVPLLLLKDLASFGHEIILLIGDFTSRIGDPTDKSAARISQTEEEIHEHMKTYVSQVERILPKNSFTVKYNSEWLASMSFADVAELASRVTVQQMSSRDMFQERMKKEKPIYVSEFLYPLMQGYDSVALDVDGEVGGNDQTFNMLMGRDLLKAYKQKEKIVLPVRLLVDAQTGKKISKTAGGFISLDDSPATIIEKVSRSIPNKMIRTVFELCTEVADDKIKERYALADKSKDWRMYNLELADELIRMYHGEEAVNEARLQYEAAIKGGVTEDAEAVVVVGTNTTPLPHILSEALGISRSEARRLIEQKAVTLNGKLITQVRGASGVQDDDVLRVGSHRPFRITLES